jgi:hypothetical protein
VALGLVLDTCRCVHVTVVKLFGVDTLFGDSVGENL